MRPAYIFLLGLICGIGFGCVLTSMLSQSALLAQEDTVTVKLAEDGWIEVYRQGELSSEWCVGHGEVYEWLTRLLEGQLAELVEETFEGEPDPFGGYIP